MNIGTPIAVDVATIENELTSLWKSASETENEHAVIRACACNLVVIAQNENEAQALPETLARVSEYHPCRSIIAYREDGNGIPAAPSTGMRAWISAQCYVPFAGGPQVCCEAITLAAGSSAVRDLPNTLVSLLVPDLPVFLYWRSFRAVDQPLVDELARFSDLLIVDTHASKDDPANRERLLELLTHAPHGIPVRDLNWSRLTAWRDLIAQFFDPPSTRHEVWDISKVEILRDVARPGNIPTRTLLLTGWLATRLNWRRKSAERKGDTWISNWQSRSGDVRVEYGGSQSGDPRVAGIASVVLRSREGTVFTVRREPGSACITATVQVEGSPLIHSVPQEASDEGSLLVRELAIAGEDTGFQAALAEALTLEKSFLGYRGLARPSKIDDQS